jgi:hypothetical protein
MADEFSAGEFIPGNIGNRDCDDQLVFGAPSGIFSYIAKFSNDDSVDVPDDIYISECVRRYHSTAQIDSLQVNTSIIGEGFISITGEVTSPKFNGVATSAKTFAPAGAFDIPHFKDSKKRIRHIVAEGPEAGIYVRGTLKDSNKIELPEYWDGIVDPETITVSLTQIGYSQDLIVERIEWGKTVKIKSGNGANIHCYYEIWAARYINPLDHDEKLHVVYEGDSPEDYPGNNECYLVGGWDYDRRETKWRHPEISVELDKES